jgi:putative DNA primase/helicase
LLNISNCVQEDARTGSPTKIVPNWVVEEIVNKLHIVTVIETAEVLKYQSGVYVKNGMQLVEQTLARDLAGLMDGKGNPMYNRKVKAEILDLLKNKTYVHQDDFDVDLDIINMKNGLFNWRTMELTEHTPHYLSTIQVPIEYIPEATCEIIEEVMREIIQPKDYIKMLEFISHLFYRKYAIRRAFVLYGPSQTGKSVFLNMLDHLLGANNCSSVPFSEMDKTFERINLCNKLLNKCGELDGITISKTAMFKDLTSGFDKIEARHLYCESFSFCNFAKIMWSTNTIAKVMDDTDGFYSRIEILPFLRKFSPSEYDQGKMDAMIEPRNLSGLFNLCIPRLGPLLERHEYTNSSNVEDIRSTYRAASDPITTFVEEYIVPCPRGKVSCDEIYEKYVKHCKLYRVKPLHLIAFNNKFSAAIRYMKQDTMKFGSKEVCAWFGINMV